jgi:hypothetical protein
MKKLLKILAYFVVMLALIIFFSPKINLYYLFEEFAVEQNIYISDEKASDNGLSLNISHAKVYLDELFLAEAEETTLSMWLVYNSFEATNIELNEGFSDFMPAVIKRINVKYHIFNPTLLSLKGESGDSFFYGDVDLLERIIQIHLRLGSQSEKRFSSSLRALKKEEGGYVYEYKF